MAMLDISGIITRLSTDLRTKFSKVSIQRNLTDGTSIAIVTVDGVQHNICAPTQPKPATLKPKMDGTAAFGSSTYYAREDHIHPTDTSRQEKLVSGTNIKTINGNSLLGSGDLTISGGTSLPAVSSSDNGKVLMVVNGAWAAGSIPSATGVSF